MLVRIGFRQGEACPKVFRHMGRGIFISVHGGDFTWSGPADPLDWLEAAIAEVRDHVSPRMGPGPQDAKQGRVINRILT